ncbi:MlaD family protein [Paraflavitalea pollutisoli]|uniref:MlaD family protein n=1 Tax=Paraflavitalea pollutisoli TaxID=3034143 RepID=UPI0023ED3124|nr:MlaD family protein [Paraflavitalea sp. H1-2-19X]
MAAKSTDHIKLGLFVMAGLAFLIVTLYLIGKDQDLFGNNFELRTRYANVQGLVVGNNVRYAGIEVGTVRKIEIISDREIEVCLVIHNKMKPFIKKTATTSIGSDGLMGNKVINIEPGIDGLAVAENDILPSRGAVNTDDMLRLLDHTNQDIAAIASSLKSTVSRINNSQGLWRLLEDSTIPMHISGSATQLQQAILRVSSMAADLQLIVADVKAGKGSLGKLLRDTAMAGAWQHTIDQLEQAGAVAGQLAARLDTTAQSLQVDITNGKGPVHVLLKDSLTAIHLSNSLRNIDLGTAAFQQNMEALKHHFLLRGYFRRQERLQQKAAKSEHGGAAMRTGP